MDKHTKHSTVPLQLKDLDDSGQFEGYASVFGIQDSDGDVIVRGAFRNTLDQYHKRAKLPKMLWQHNPYELIGKWDEMEEDDRGLRVKGHLLMDVNKGREAYSMLKAGVLDGMSIGFNIVEAAASEELRGRGRVIEEIDLWEVSLVTWGANPEALVSSVKARKSIRDFERFLRDAGFSKREAVAVASGGFKAMERGEPANDEGLADALAQLRKSMNTGGE